MTHTVDRATGGLIFECSNEELTSLREAYFGSGSAAGRTLVDRMNAEQAKLVRKNPDQPSFIIRESSQFQLTQS